MCGCSLLFLVELRLSVFPEIFVDSSASLELLGENCLHL